MTTIAPPSAAVPSAPLLEVVGGVDTHADTHTAAAVDSAGRDLGTATFATTTAGYAALLAWLCSFGSVTVVGIEGTGAYGAGLARHLAAAGLALVEVDRPDRKTRRSAGKSDPIDALAAARAALSGRAMGTPKERTGEVEGLRVLRVARRCAVAHRADAQRRMKALVITAPEPLRARLRDLRTQALVTECAALRPDRTRPGDPEQAHKIALRSLARHHQELTEEITDLESLIDPLVADIAPNLLALHGVGPDVAGQLLVTAGANPERMHSEAAFAALTGVAPIPASSGRTHRHRLNRGGDRAANCALWRIAITRMATDARTRAYVERRTHQGLSKKDIIRCLKRYIAREVYAVLCPPQARHHDVTLAA